MQVSATFHTGSDKLYTTASRLCDNILWSSDLTAVRPNWVAISLVPGFPCFSFFIACSTCCNSSFWPLASNCKQSNAGARGCLGTNLDRYMYSSSHVRYQLQKYISMLSHVTRSVTTSYIYINYHCSSLSSSTLNLWRQFRVIKNTNKKKNHL